MMAANAMQAAGQAAAAVLVLAGEARVWHLVVLAAVRGPAWVSVLSSLAGTPAADRP